MRVFISLLCVSSIADFSKAFRHHSRLVSSHNCFLCHRSEFRSSVSNNINLHKEDSMRSSPAKLEDKVENKIIVDYLQKTLHTLLPLANNGDLSAQYAVCQKYITGFETAKNPEMSFKYGKMAADQGNKYCQAFVARSYTMGDGVDKNLENAADYWKLLADQGNAVGQYVLGVLLGNKGNKEDKPEVRRLYQLSALQGHQQAQSNLAFMYENGIGGDMSKEEAFKWYKVAADQNNAEAQYRVGHYYLTGKGVNVNYEEAFKYFKMSSDNGNAEAHFSLGECYSYGHVVSCNSKKAFEYFKMAADQRHLSVRKIEKEYYKAIDISDTFTSKEPIEQNQRIVSQGGEYTAIFQDDGNFVIHGNYDREQKSIKAIWSIGIYQEHLTDYHMSFNASGNLQILNEENVIWQTKTEGKNMRLVMQRDGNLVMYDGNNKKHWESGSSKTKSHELDVSSLIVID